LAATDSWIHDFLLLRYQDMDFLVDRNQFSASTSIETIYPVSKSLPYWGHWAWYNEQRLLLFDMNQYLKDLYHCRQSGNARLCLIIKTEDFIPQARHMITRLLRNSSKLSQQHLGIIVNSQAEIHTLNLKEIYLSPSSVRDFLSCRGFYGCRFPENQRIQYLVDLQKYVLYTLEAPRRTNETAAG